MNRKITIDAEGIILLFNKEETTLKKLASNYIDHIQDAFSKISKSDFIVKTAFTQDIEDVMIDYWNIKADPSKTSYNSELSDDPLDRLGENFSGIVEYKDDDKGEINPIADVAQQQEIEEDDSEEFLSDDELEIEEND